ncbi:hypothetical protein ACFX4I_24085 [Peribacillus sp. YIM B13472]
MKENLGVSYNGYEKNSSSIDIQKENGKSNVVGMNDIVQNAMTLVHT